MPRLMKIGSFALAGGLGGAAAWVFILAFASSPGDGLAIELLLGGLAGLWIGAFIWSSESFSGRQFSLGARRAGLGALAGTAGGVMGAYLGNTLFTLLGELVADIGGLTARHGVSVAVALGWAVLGSAVGMSGGLMIRSRDRAVYGGAGGFLGGLFGGFLFNALSPAGLWPALAGLSLLGLSIGGFISFVEEAFVSASVKVIKGRHLGREFSLLKNTNIVGRDDRSDVCLSGSEGVALRHAKVLRMDGRFVIEPEEGGPGVYVNHRLTKQSRLKDGDIIRVGSILLLFTAMRKAAAAIALALLAGPLFFSAAQARAEEPAAVTITQFDLSDFPAVRAYVSVLDRDGRPLRGLGPGDMEVAENGRSLKISSVLMRGTKEAAEPLTLSLIIDRSGSMEGAKIHRAREAVLRFLSLMEPGDRASLISFSDRVEELAPLTKDVTALKDAAQTVEPGGHTALYDAVAAGVESVKSAPGRKAVIVLSDGIANRGALDIGQAIDAGVNASVSVYVIGLGEDVRTGRLERIARETGGTCFFTPSEEGLAAIYETISRRIRNEYVAVFDTARKGEYLRNVALTVRPGGKAERAYFQPRSSLFGTGGKPPAWAWAVPLASIAGLLALSARRLDRRYGTGHLSVVKGSASRKETDIPAAVTIGRDERNSLGLFKDDRIEQRHAEVLPQDGSFVIRDQGSAFGTFVNGEKVLGPRPLKDGDVIEIGEARVVFSEGGRSGCRACGSPLRSGARFCPKCGARMA
jgi:VWFA-related protein